MFPNDQSTTKVIIIPGRHLSRKLGKMLQEPQRPNLERRICEAIVHYQHIFTSSSTALFRRGYACVYMCEGETRGGRGGRGERESGG